MSMSMSIPCQVLGGQRELEAFANGVVHQLRKEVLETPSF